MKCSKYFLIILPFAMILQQVKAIRFYCNLFETKQEPLGNVYKCFLTKVDEIENQAVSKVFGNHLDRKSGNDVKLLHSNKAKLTYMPHNIESFFANLIGIFMYNTGIKELSQESFKYLPLTYLMFQKNEITQLSGDIFSQNKKLTYINFKNNSLKAISSDFFDEMPELKTALFSKNCCIDADAKTSAELSQLKIKMRRCFDGVLNPTTKRPIRTTSIPIFKGSCSTTNEDALREENKKLKLENANLEAKFEKDLTTLTEELSRKRNENKKLLENLGFCNENHEETKSNLNKVHRELGSLKSGQKTSDTACPAIISDVLSMTCAVSDWNNNKSVCNVLKLDIRREDQKITRVNVKDQIAVEISEISEISALNQYMEFLPIGVENIFPKLTKLTVSNSHVTKINSKTLNFENLKHLVLSFNKIDNFDVSDFEKLGSLEHLDVSDNFIKGLPAGTFNPLQKLKVLKLNNNFIEKISADIFKNNLELEVLLLDGNKLKSIETEFSNRLENIKVINLERNDCGKKIFEGSEIKSLKRILSEDCEEPLKICCRYSFLGRDRTCRTTEFELTKPNKNIDSVRSYDQCIKEDTGIDPRARNVIDSALEFIDQVVHYLPSDLSHHFPGLKKLLVVNSKLLVVKKDDFLGLLFLTHLDLSRNDLTKIDADVLENVPQLEHFDFSGNRIEELPQKAFANLSELKYLHARNNSMSQLKTLLFGKKNKLEIVDFSFNNLVEVERKIITSLENVKSLDFTGNECIDGKFPENMSLSTMKDLAEKSEM